jgi:acyl transferase domain-containing protein/acyl carrier protein
MSTSPGVVAPTQSVLKERLIEVLAQKNGVTPGEIDARQPFTRYGLDSHGAVALSRMLSELAGREISPTVFWRYPSVEALARHLTSGASDDAPRGEKRVTAQISRHEPIAVVGMSCRLPGAPDIDSFWKLLVNGVDAVAETPPNRWNDGRLQQAERGAGAQHVPPRAGFLKDIEGFDPLFFGISPREATEMDPQQRLFLELAWEALEDAGIVPRELNSTATGVFVGAIWRDYAELGGSEFGRITAHTATGQALNMIANRLSYVLGLQGPSLVLDTACSSSLVAVHMACQSLWAGESSTAIVGGVSIMASPHTMVALTRFGGLSPDGRCKAFDASADGFGRGEGGGVVILKPLSAAIAAGDSIRCVIRATGVNNDGPSNGLTAPSPEAQEKLIRQVYARGQIKLSSVGYMETHGTGTALGDPIEAGALGAVFAQERVGGPPLMIGSVKTNIGHLEGAAGIAGLLKAILCVKHRTVVPSLHFNQPNPHIPFDTLRLEVSRKAESWPVPEGPAIAGVSSFGWGGTNAHVAIEELPTQPIALLRLAAADSAGMTALASQALAGAETEQSLNTVCDELARTSQGPLRFAAGVRSKAELKSRLQAIQEGSTGVGALGKTLGRPAKVAFICSPQGGQWIGMGRKLLRTEDVFRAAFARAEAAFAVHTGWLLRDELFKEEGSHRFDDVDVIQPMLFAFQVALAEQWRAWGVTPDVVIGHSLGEIAAAHIAGILDLNDATLAMYHYSRLQKLLADRGGMAIVNLPPENLTEMLKKWSGRIVLAGHNGPRSTVLSGDPSALDQLIAELKAQKEMCARVRVNVAAHSPQIDEIVPEMVSVLSVLKPQPARIRMISTATKSRLEGPEVDGRYFAKNLRDAVLLAPVLDSLLAEGVDALVEISPHPVLGAALQQAAEQAQTPPLVLGCTKRDEDERLAFYEARAALFRLGVPNEERGALHDELVPLTAHTPQALRELAGQVAAAVRAQPELTLEAVASTLATHRTHHSERIAVVARSRHDLAEALSAFSQNVTHERRATSGSGKRPGIVFVFPGQGSQWLGMGKQLLREEPAFRAEVERCDAAIRALVGWSVISELEAPAESSQMSRVDVVQPVLFTVAAGLAALWRSWGVEPKAVIGHSMGEVAASYVAGAISLEHAAQIICRRSQLLRRVSGQGAMLAAELTLEEAQMAIRRREHLVSVAVSNSARSTVLSGNREALEAISESLNAGGVFWRWVKVDVASHSPQMDVLKDDLLKVLEGVTPKAAPIPIYSTVLNSVTDGRDFLPPYWVRNLRDPVLFASAVRQARASGLDVFLEMSPHPILLPAVEQELADMEETGEVLPSLRRNDPERESMLRSLSALFSRGVDPRWSAISRSAHSAVSLPIYPWQRERFWIDHAPRTVTPTFVGQGVAGLLGMHIPSAADPKLHHWQTEWGVNVTSFLEGHNVGNDVVAPGAIFMMMALQAGREAVGKGLRTVKQISFSHALALAPDAQPSLQTVMKAHDEGQEIQVFSMGGEQGWMLHARSVIDGGSGDTSGGRMTQALAVKDEMVRSAAMVLDQSRYYELLGGCGLEYQSAFRSIESVWSKDQRAFGRIAVPSTGVAEPELIQVACIDSALQIAIATLPPSIVFRGRQLISTGADGFTFHQAPSSAFQVYARCNGGTDANMFSVDVEAFTEIGEVLFHVEGLKIRVLEVAAPTSRSEKQREPAQAARTLLDELSQIEPGRRKSRAVQELRQIVAVVVKLAVERVPLDQPLRTLGMDSVMSLELRNRIEARVGIRVSATVLWNHPTVENLAEFLLQHVPSSSPTVQEPAAKPKPSKPQPVKGAAAEAISLESLSDADAQRLLEAELSHVLQIIKE